MNDASEHTCDQGQLSREQQSQEDEYRFPYHYLDLIPQLEHALSTPSSYRRWVRDLIGSRPGQRVLDAGCGDGRFCYDLRNEDLVISGLDYSERAIGFARAFSPSVDFHVGDLAGFRPAEKFDVVVMLEVLEHIKLDEVCQVVRNVHACLADNGRFIVTVPSTRIPVGPKHFQHFSQESLTRALSPCFDVLEVHGHMRMGFRRWLAIQMLNRAVFVTGSLRRKSFLIRLYFKIAFHIFRTIERCGPDEGERVVAVFRKRSEVS